ncbi:hypothetical protein VTN77DRAFT_6954 [Rasamsonia byssochlamydoides]|uniref:uncharacterized protein n=1 Tax=Rasamsonia byssochlamydoides TaxID=89139 RepID=UPI00374296A7
MAISFRDVISIIELVVYFPSLFIAIFVASRHGFSRSSGWIFLVLFTLVRIIGACASLATISNQSVGLYITAAICSSVGLSPLIMTNVGLLSRANDSIARNTGNEVNPFAFRIVHLVTIVGLILSILGQTHNTTREGLTQIQSKTKIGVILFIVSWVLLCLLLLTLSGRRSDIESGEHRLLGAVGLSLPFIFVRLLYSILVVFVNNSTFNLVTGNVAVMFIMSVLVEFVVVVVCLGVGLTLQVRPAYDRDAAVAADDSEYPLQQRQQQREPMMPKAYEQEERPFPRRSERRRGGPIHMLVGMAMDAVEERSRR